MNIAVEAEDCNVTIHLYVGVCEYAILISHGKVVQVEDCTVSKYVSTNGCDTGVNFDNDRDPPTHTANTFAPFPLCRHKNISVLCY